MIPRKETKKVRCGDLYIGGGEPISVQSMTNVDSRNEKALLEQIARLKDAGCQIVRIAVPNEEAAMVFGQVKKKIGNKLPLVADIHFDYRLALAAIKAGADKVRINPGNIGSVDRVRAVVNAAKERDIPIRVGVNSGSLEKDILQKYGKVTAEGLCESAINNLRIIEELGYDKLVVSIKSSDVVTNFRAHKLLSESTDYPIHIGITEAGTLERGKTKSAVGIGSLLLNGIGDTMRVSLTADPVLEVGYAYEILKTLGLRKSAVDIVSCPTCGRTQISLEKLALEVEEGLKPLEKKLEKSGKGGIKVAVMGCAVNGPGEAREADFGVAGGVGKGLIFSKGKIIKTVSEDDIVKVLLETIEENIKCEK